MMGDQVESHCRGPLRKKSKKIKFWKKILKTLKKSKITYTDGVSRP
jgi:hypothetical protein